ncbi:MAG: calcium-binding protein, partial [Alphaproteobacteria bacterium]|nr:calcium-binding protein [Alphaproteobacteria bacterium]
NDVIHGGSGNDLLAGQGGDDLLFGDEGDDTLFGGEGDDTLFGGPGNDFLSGNDGNDVLISTEGSDDLDGGRGDDVLIGHDGPETVWMNGGEGDDTLMPGANDFASGNSGADMFILHQAAGGIPTIADFDSSEDQLVLHLDADVARTAQLSLHEDEDGTFLLNVNGNAIGRLLQHGGLRVEDVRIVPVKA